jgi:bacterioferritin-associated ferredoxin
MVVEEAEVRRAVRAGARTVEDVGARCEAGTGCGSCRAVIAVVLAEEAMRRASKGDDAIPVQLLAQLGLFRRPDSE